MNQACGRFNPALGDSSEVIPSYSIFWWLKDTAHYTLLPRSTLTRPLHISFDRPE